MRDPVPVGGTYDSVTLELTLTFDERIASATPAQGDIVVEGTPTVVRNSDLPAALVGRRVTWPTIATALEPTPPLRATYIPTVGTIVGVGGGTVQAFADFPLTLV